MFEGELTDRVAVCDHTVFVCILGEEPLINIGPWNLFSSSVVRRTNPHSGSVSSHCDCLYCEERTPYKHGALKRAFQ